MTTTARAYGTDHSIRDWRVRLDARINRCPGCDQWRWDDICAACNVADDELPAGSAAA